MREPPLGLDVVPEENLANLFDAILAAVPTEKLLAGIYEPKIKGQDKGQVLSRGALRDLRVCVVG